MATETKIRGDEPERRTRLGEIVEICPRVGGQRCPSFNLGREMVGQVCLTISLAPNRPIAISARENPRKVVRASVCEALVDWRCSDAQR